MKAILLGILIAVLMAGCIEGPTGPQGEKGDKGDIGEEYTIVQYTGVLNSSNRHWDERNGKDNYIISCPCYIDGQAAVSAGFSFYEIMVFVHPESYGKWLIPEYSYSTSIGLLEILIHGDIQIRNEYNNLVKQSLFNGSYKINITLRATK